MNLKKILTSLLFPHTAVMIMLLSIASVFLIYSMIFLGSTSAIAIISYVLAFYTLSVWCVKIPKIIKFFKNFKNENKFAKKWLSDERLRINVSLYGTLMLNVIYAAFQLALGFWHSSFWYYSLALYYISLAVMRFFLIKYTRRYAPGEKMHLELIKYRNCGIAFLVMNVALALIIFFMIYWGRTFVHHEITTIALAAYTFISLTIAIVNIIKHRKHTSPVYTASRAIALAAACVSMLTLESTMLTTFGGQGESPVFRRIMLASSGGVISAFIIFMAIYMIASATKRIRSLK